MPQPSDLSRLNRRGLLGAGLAVSGAALMSSACSPLGLLNAVGPRDGTARQVAKGLAYGSEPRQRLDIYAPSGQPPSGGWPVVVFFYGGGWEDGSRDLYGWAAQALAAQGFLVALPDYRLVPQVHFPAFIEDAALATAWVGQIAGDHGGHRHRLAVAGHSAGAYLALMIALDRRYMQAVQASNLIRAAAGLAGPYDFLPLDVPASVNAFSRAPDLTLTQPVTFVRADAPPLWLGHGTEDMTVHAQDSEILCARQKAVGGACELKLYAELNHADLIATFSPLFRRKAPVLADLSAFLHHRLSR